MAITNLQVGQEVALDGDNSGWLLVDQLDGGMVRLLRTLEDSTVRSAGFWVNADLVREARWPQT